MSRDKKNGTEGGCIFIFIYAGKVLEQILFLYIH